MRISLKQNCTLLIAVVALGGLVGAGVQAEEPMRWKFKVGQKIDCDIVSEMQLAASGPALPQEMKTSMHQEMKMTWDVVGVDDKSGEAVIRLKFARAKMKMSTPLGGLDYDSASEEVPTGPAAMIAPMYKAITDGEFEITMTSRGEVKDVKIPEQVVAALKNLPNAAEMGDVASPEGFKKMLSQGVLVLPNDAPKNGETWSSKVESQIPIAGKQTIETTFRYDGVKDIKGTKFGVIKLQRKIEFENKVAEKTEQPQQPAAQQNIQVKVKDQKSDGEMLFNIAAGRLQSTSLTQNVVTETSSNGQTIQTNKIDQKINVTMTPAGEKKADDAKKSEPSGEKADKAEKADKPK